MYYLIGRSHPLFPDHIRLLNAARNSRSTFKLAWRRTFSSKALQRIKTPSRRKEAVSSAKLDQRSFSYLGLAPKDTLLPLI